MFACLPYFLHWFHALLSCFFLLNCSLLHCFVVCRFFSVPLARSGQLAFILNSFFLWCRLCLMFFPLCLLCFTLLLSFSCSFLARFVLAFFCYANDLDTSISAYSFSFFLASLFAFWRSNIENTHHSAPQTSYFPSSPPLWSSLTTMPIPAHFLVFCVVCMRCKIYLAHPFIALFTLFLRSARALTPHRIHRNRSIFIRAHSHRILPNSQKHDVRGNFPGHSHWHMPCKSIFVCSCLVSMPPHACYASTHPSAPIHTHLHHFLPICTAFLQCMYVNLIEK